MARFAAVFVCLSAVGCGASAVDELIGQLKNSDPEVRRSAARALGEMGTEATDAVAALQATAGDTDREVRRLSCHALGEIGPAAKPALAGLSQALEDKELSVRLSAAFALQKIEPASEAYVPQLTEAMRRGDGGVIVAVGRMEPSPTWAVPTLIELLGDRRPGIRRLAVEALGGISPTTAEMKSELEKASQDPDDRVRDAAGNALKWIESSRQPDAPQSPNE